MVVRGPFLWLLFPPANRAMVSAADNRSSPKYHYEAFFRFALGSDLASDLDAGALSLLRLRFFSSCFFAFLSVLFSPLFVFRTASLSDWLAQAGASNSSTSLSPDSIGSGTGCVRDDG